MYALLGLFQMIAGTIYTRTHIACGWVAAQSYNVVLLLRQWRREDLLSAYARRSWPKPCLTEWRDAYTTQATLLRSLISCVSSGANPTPITGFATERRESRRSTALPT